MLIGEIIRQKIKEDRRTAKSICEEVGMTRGNLDKIYHKAFISTKLLKRFSKVLNYDFSVHLGATNETSIDEEGSEGDTLREKDHPYGEPIEMRLLRERNVSLERELGYLDQTINAMKNNLHDKDEIINLQRDKISLLEQLNVTLKVKATKPKPAK
jgi:transcriptional regulator with XRE-family HTH domain